MKCPKCGFVSFDYLDQCKKCGASLADHKRKMNIGAGMPLYASAASKSGGDLIGIVSPGPIPSPIAKPEKKGLFGRFGGKKKAAESFEPRSFSAPAESASVDEQIRKIRMESEVVQPKPIQPETEKSAPIPFGRFDEEDEFREKPVEKDFSFKPASAPVRERPQPTPPPIAKPAPPAAPKPRIIEEVRPAPKSATPQPPAPKPAEVQAQPAQDPVEADFQEVANSLDRIIAKERESFGKGSAAGRQGNP